MGKENKSSSANLASLEAKVLLTPSPADPMKVSIHQLSNGLKVYISTDRSTPSVVTQIAVKAGSRNDPANSTGLAHYLEHMLFKGTSTFGSLDFKKEKPHLDNIAKLYDDLRSASTPDKKRRILSNIDKETQLSSQYSVPNEFDNLYASIGIDAVNAYTSDEETVYIATVPSNRFETWANVEGDRFSDPQFRLFYPELESVYEEKNKTLDNPYSRVQEELTKALYPKHPYGTQPTIGTVEHLKTPAYGDMVDYFNTWYRPNNMAIILAGDIDASRAIPVLEKAFGLLKPKALPDLPQYNLAPPSKRTQIEVLAPGEQSVVVAWPTVPTGHPDEIVLHAMDLVVDNASTGLINIDLVLSQELTSAGSYPEHQKEAGKWVMQGTAKTGQTLSEVESLLMTIVDKLKNGQFTQADLDAIVVNSQIQDSRKRESNESRVSAMTKSFIQEQDWTDTVTRPTRLAAVKREDIIRVAKKYLTNAPVVIQRKKGTFSAPKVEKPSITAIKIDSSKISPKAKQLKAIPVKALSPQWLVKGQHYQQDTLPSGSIITVKNERNKLFSIAYDFDIGRQSSPLLCYALQLVEQGGAGTRTAKEFQKELYALGTTISFYCSDRRSGIIIEGTDENTEQSIVLLKEWLQSTSLATDTLRKLTENTISRRKDTMQEPSAISAALSAFAISGRDSIFLRVTSNKKLKSTRSKALLKLSSSLPNFKHRTNYFGPRALSGIRPFIDIGSNHQTPKKPNMVRYNRQRIPTIFFLNRPEAQARVQIAFPASPITNDNTINAKLFNQYVGGGMGGLVFQEIREARGLAYSAWAYFQSGSRKGDQTIILAGLGTQADKTTSAIKTMLSILVPLKTEQSRFDTAKTSMEADYRKTRIPPRARAFSVIAWDLQGLPSDPRKSEFKSLQTKKTVDMQEFADSRTKSPVIISISGDSSRINLKSLRGIVGKVRLRTMKTSQIFGYTK